MDVAVIVTVFVVVVSSVMVIGWVTRGAYGVRNRKSTYHHQGREGVSLLVVLIPVTLYDTVHVFGITVVLVVGVHLGLYFPHVWTVMVL